MKKPQIARIESAKSIARRAIAQTVARGDAEKAFQLIDTALASEIDLSCQGKLLLLAGSASEKRGNFDDAFAAYAKSAKLGDNPRYWLAPSLGKIRVLLRNVQVAEAALEAEACVALAKKKLQDFDAAKLLAKSQFRSGGQFFVPIKPHRLCVVLSKIGQTFLDQGEPETAKKYFSDATIANPRGACRARQGLSQIALQNDDPSQAFQSAIEALTLGKFQAKTVSAWKLLLAAKRKLQDDQISPDLLAALKASHPKVKERATLEIVKLLKANGNPQWKSIANDWLSSADSSQATSVAELRKIFVSHGKKVNEAPAAQAFLAQALMNTPELTSQDWLAAAKEYVRNVFFAGQFPDIDGIVARGTVLYGAEFANNIRHGLALAAMMAKRHDIARGLLNVVIGSSTDPVRSKAQWALADMELVLNNSKQASNIFAQIADNPKVPQKFRIQANLKSLSAILEKSGDDIDDLAKARIQKSIAALDDPEMLMNFARQIKFSQLGVKSLADEAFAKGEKATSAQFLAATHPSVALGILFKLTRRQFNDFNRYAAIVNMWKSLSQTKIDWLWSENSKFWQYVSFVSQSLAAQKDFAQASAIATKYLNDAATPKNGLVILGIPYYEMLIRNGSVKEAFPGFTWLISEAPGQAENATAYYWLSLSKFKSGNLAEAARLSDCGRACLKALVGMPAYWGLDAQLALLKAGLNPKAVSLEEVNYNEDLLGEALHTINKDTKLI